MILLLLMGSCDESADDPQSNSNGAAPEPVIENPMHSGAVTYGTFTSYQHNLHGAAAVYVDTLGMTTIRLVEFTMSQGPDVRVYLSRSNNYSKANTIEIARLTESYSMQNINLPVASYSQEFKFVLVYCLQFNSLFGYAELK